MGCMGSAHRTNRPGECDLLTVHRCQRVRSREMERQLSSLASQARRLTSQIHRLETDLGHHFQRILQSAVDLNRAIDNRIENDRGDEFFHLRQRLATLQQGLCEICSHIRASFPTQLGA